MSSNLDQDWQHWIQNNRQAISDGFEYKFVIAILSRISLITSHDVTAQYTFKDSTNRNRRIDFVIQNKQKGLFLAIELDGARRGEQELQSQWADFLQRQNDLLETVGPLLRFSNSQMFKNPSAIIERISYSLSIQIVQYKEKTALKKHHEEVQQEIWQLHAALRESEKTITSLRNTPNEVQSSHELINAKEIEAEYKKTYQEKVVMLESLNAQMNHQRISQLEIAQKETETKLSNKTKENRTMLKTMIFLTVIVVASMITIIYLNIGPNTLPNKYITDYDVENHSYRLNANRASSYIGKKIVLCGTVVQKTNFEKGVYLNFDKYFPNQSLTAVIWDENLNDIQLKFGHLINLVNKNVCVSGTVRKYRDQLQIWVAKPSDLYFE